MENQIHPKLSHLSESQIQSLIARYYSHEKIQALLDEYQIDCIPSHFCSLLPPETVYGQQCPYCDVSMVRKRVSRSSLKYRQLDVSCPQCGHYVGRWQCHCAHCVEDRRQFAQMMRDAKEEKIRAFCLTTRPTDIHQPAAQDLDLRTAVALLALARTCLIVDEVDGDQSSPSRMTLEALADATIPFAPRGDLVFFLLAQLSTQGLIAISESSPPDAFTFEEGELRSYDPLRARWLLSVKDPDNLLSEISRVAQNAAEWPSHWEQAVNDVWVEIALAECKEYFRCAAEERRLPEAGEKSTETMLRSLLESFSVAQCYRIIWTCAQRSSDFLVRKRCTRQHAANYMIGECQRWSDRAKAENWGVKPFKRNFNLPRSSISHVFFDVFLKIGEDGFDCVPGMPGKHRSTVFAEQPDCAQH